MGGAAQRHEQLRLAVADPVRHQRQHRRRDRTRRRSPIWLLRWETSRGNPADLDRARRRRQHRHRDRLRHQAGARADHRRQLLDAVAPLERWIVPALPLAAASPETLVVFGLDPDSTWYFAIKTHDEAPNTSDVSNSPSAQPHAGSLMNRTSATPRTSATCTRTPATRTASRPRPSPTRSRATPRRRRSTSSPSPSTTTSAPGVARPLQRTQERVRRRQRRRQLRRDLRAGMGPGVRRPRQHLRGADAVWLGRGPVRRVHAAVELCGTLHCGDGQPTRQRSADRASSATPPRATSTPCRSPPTARR